MKQFIKLSSFFCLAIIVLMACTSKTPQPQKTMAVPATNTESEQTSENELGVNFSDLARGPKVFEVVEQMPQFPGGEEKMFEFINKNLKYPAIANECCVQGKTIVQFIVTRKGKLQNFVVSRSLAPAFDKEAIRVLKIMPRWIPGKQNGVNVDVYYTVPIKFELE